MEPIGVYTITNCLALLIYEINAQTELILVGKNTDTEKEWYPIEEIYDNETEQYRTGFKWGEIPVYLDEIMRI